MPSINSPSNKIPNKYAIIIDAGSSGSRVYIFEWPDPQVLTARGGLSLSDLGALPNVRHEASWTKKITPGISTFVNDQQDIWSEHLQELVEHAEAIIPGAHHASTPIFFMATAGMRLLRPLDQEGIMAKVCSLLREKTNFSIADCSSNVQIIDGETEGLYGWVALNYLSGTIKNPTNVPTLDGVTTGFMDMGGASAQIAFSPNSSETARHSDDLYHINLRTLDGLVHDWPVFVGTWLGFGANEARTRLSQQLAMHGKTHDPCLPQGLKSEVLPVNSTQPVSLEGTASFEQCLMEARPLLNKHLSCIDEPCLFNGVHVPALDFRTTRFVGVSEYWYTAHDIFGIGGAYDFAVFEERAKEYCSLSWQQIVENSDKGLYNNVSKDKLQNACFKATWITNILHEGFGVPIDDAFGPNINADSAAKTSISPYPSTFQSVSHVNGIEMSWPLGQAVLYSSSQIPARSGTKGVHVGYLPSLTSGGDGQFMAAGDPLLSLDTLLTPSVGDSSKNIVIFLFLGLLFLAFLFLFNKTRRLTHHWKKRISNMVSPLLRSSSDSESKNRLLEEGLSLRSLKAPFTARNHGVSDANDYRNSEFAKPHSSSGLGTSTSMVDLKGGSMISREGSRMSLRPPDPSSPSSFSFEDSPPQK